MRSAQNRRFLSRVEHNPCSTARISPRKLRSRLTYSHAGTHSRTCRVAAYVIEHCVVSRRVTFCRPLHICSIIYLAIFIKISFDKQTFCKRLQIDCETKKIYAPNIFCSLQFYFFFCVIYRDQEKGN